MKVNALLMVFLLLFNFSGFSQEDPEKVRVISTPNKSIEKQTQDKNKCYTYADNTVEKKKHRTLKTTGIGAGIGAVAGKIIGKPGTGAAAGGAAGAYKGHKKSKKEEKAFNETYASCLRDKGYSVEVEN